MAYVEIWKKGVVVSRRPVDDAKARAGVVVRLGAAGQASIQSGQTIRLGVYEVRVLEGPIPPEAGAMASQATRADEPPVQKAPIAGAESSDQHVPTVDGYQVTGRLGEGGMGTVWKALQLSTRRAVALKFLSERRFASAKAKARFEREVELSARLEHPNIARVYDSGLTRGVYYYALEFIDGAALGDYVTQHGLSPRQVLELMQRVCQAVQYAHQRGVIHRDLKPSNILVTPDGQPHVLDFGLAKALIEEDGQERHATLSVEGEVSGTPAYMSPEQAAGRHDQTDTRSDVYTLGVILFELLTGQFPHEMSGTRYELIRRIVEEEVRRPRDASGAIDAELESLLLKALAQRPEDRYASAGELGDDIGRYLGGDPLSARPATTMYFFRKRLRKHRVPVAIAAGVAAMLVAVGVVAYVRVSAERSQAQAEAAKADRAAGRERDARVLAESRQEQLTTALHDLGRESYYNIIALADSKIAQGAYDQARILLASASREYRHWEWGRLMTLCHLDVLTLEGGSTMTGAAYSPDGRRIATSSFTQTAVIWDAATGRELSVLRGHGGVVFRDAWSRDGRKIVIVTPNLKNTAKVWDVQTGDALLTLQGHSDMVISAGFSPDGLRIVTASRDKTAKVWDAQSGDVLLTLQGHSAPVFCASYSPDGRRIVTASQDKTAKVWDAQSGGDLLTLEGHLAPVHAASFSPDGLRIVTASDDLTARIWDTQNGKPLLTLPVHPAFVRLAVFSPDGQRIVTSCWDKPGMEDRDGVKAWDASTGRELFTVPGHSNVVLSVAFSPDRRWMVTASADGTAKIWDAAFPQVPQPLPAPAAPGEAGTLSPDGRCIVKRGANGSAKVCDTQTGRELFTLGGRPIQFRCIVFSLDGQRIVTGSEDKTAQVWDAQTGRLLLTLLGHGDTVTAAAFSPDGLRIATGSYDHTAKLWDARTGRELLTVTFKGHLAEGSIGLAFLPDGRGIVARYTGGPPEVWHAMDWTRTVEELGQDRLTRYQDRMAKILAKEAGAPGAGQPAAPPRESATPDARAAIPDTQPASRPAGSTALRFSRDGQCVLVPPADGLEVTGPITVEAWVKAEGHVAQKRFAFIVSKQSSPTGYALLSEQNRLCFEAGGKSVWAEAGVPVGKWTHVAGVWDGAQLSLYVNGVPAGRQASPQAPIANNLPLWIGSSPFGNNTNWSGSIEEVRIWAVARTPQQIRQDMGPGLTGKEPGLRAGWNFDEGAGQEVRSLSGHAPPGRLGNQTQADPEDPDWVPGVGT